MVSCILTKGRPTISMGLNGSCRVLSSHTWQLKMIQWGGNRWVIVFWSHQWVRGRKDNYYYRLVSWLTHHFFKDPTPSHQFLEGFRLALSFSLKLLVDSRLRICGLPRGLPRRRIRWGRFPGRTPMRKGICTGWRELHYATAFKMTLVFLHIPHY